MANSGERQILFFHMFYHFLNILVSFQSILEGDKLLLKWGYRQNNGMCFLQVVHKPVGDPS